MSKAPRLRRSVRVWLVTMAIGVPVIVVLEWLGVEYSGAIAVAIGASASAEWEARRARKE